MLRDGDITYFEDLAKKRAEEIYNAIEESKHVYESGLAPFYYKSDVMPELRSWMNQTFYIEG